MSKDTRVPEPKHDIAEIVREVMQAARRKRNRKPRASRIMYRKAIISYVDVLGFKKHISERSAGDILRLLRVFRKRFAPDEHEAKVIALRGVSFSDLIVRVTFVPEDSPANGPDGYVFWELLGLVLAQIELLFEGILVRGSVSLGEIYCSPGTIFGPGLVSAYQAELKAVYPRIVVSEDLLKAAVNPPFRKRDHSAKEELQYIADLVSTDNDGYHYLDCLRAAPQNLDEPGDFLTLLQKHKALIEAGLKEHAGDPHTLDKFIWLSAKHKKAVKALSPHVLEGYGFKKTDLFIRPS